MLSFRHCLLGSKSLDPVLLVSMGSPQVAKFTKLNSI